MSVDTGVPARITTTPTNQNPLCYSDPFRMRPKLFILALTAALYGLRRLRFHGPATSAVARIPKPPNDLRASRQGDRVSLVWTVPSQTTDRQSVRYLGPARICRAVDAPSTQCDPRRRSSQSYSPTP